MNRKKILLLIVATFTMLVLSAIAVVTSLKLRESATEPITPNVPASKPKAAGTACGGIQGIMCPTGEECIYAGGVKIAPHPDASGTCETIVVKDAGAFVCQTSFTVTAIACGGGCTTTTDCGTGLFCDTGRTPAVCALQECTSKTDPCACTGDISCTHKHAYKDDSRNAPPVYYLEAAIAANSDLTRGQVIVYTVGYKNTSAAAVANATITDVLPAEVDFKDASAGCLPSTDRRTVTCTLGTVPANTTSQRAIRVTVKSDAAAGSFTNSATVKAGEQASNCSIPLKVNVPGAPVCNDTCSSDDQCPSDNKCISGRCRNPSCSGEADCTCALVCNDSCSSDDQCPSDLKCVSGKCRNTSCSGEADCTCNTSTPTPTPTGTPTGTPRPTPIPGELPTVGTTLPTYLFILAGGVLAVLGMLLVAL